MLAEKEDLSKCQLRNTNHNLLFRPKSGIVSVKLPMGTPRVSMSDKPTLDKKRVSVSDKTTLATKRVCVSEKPPADKQWPFIAPPVQFEIRVERFEGRVISHLSSEALLIKGIDENYPSRFCLVCYYFFKRY